MYFLKTRAIRIFTGASMYFGAIGFMAAHGWHGPSHLGCALASMALLLWGSRVAFHPSNVTGKE